MEEGHKPFSTVLASRSQKAGAAREGKKSKKMGSGYVCSEETGYGGTLEACMLLY